MMICHCGIKSWQRYSQQHYHSSVALVGSKVTDSYNRILSPKTGDPVLSFELCHQFAKMKHRRGGYARLYSFRAKIKCCSMCIITSENNLIRTPRSGLFSTEQRNKHPPSDLGCYVVAPFSPFLGKVYIEKKFYVTILLLLLPFCNKNRSRFLRFLGGILISNKQASDLGCYALEGHFFNR